MQRMRSDQTECEVNHEENCSLTATSGCSAVCFALPRWRMETFLGSLQTAHNVPLKTFANRLFVWNDRELCGTTFGRVAKKFSDRKVVAGLCHAHVVCLSAVIPRNAVRQSGSRTTALLQAA